MSKLEEVKTLKGIEAVKDAYRRMKIKCGDHRGMKNRFKLAERFGINPQMVMFNSIAPNHGEKVEIEVSISDPKYDSPTYVWKLSDLIVELKDIKTCEISITAYRWNKLRTDRNRIERTDYIYEAKN
jgi:hypothetical protein